jgi:hypothetical protein
MSPAAYADFLDRVDLQPAVVSGFLSYHIDTNKHYNQDNWGLGVRLPKVDVLVGYYHNSDYKSSFYAVYEARWKLTDNLQVGAAAGGVTGYKRAVSPLILPELVLQVWRIELAATYVPHVTRELPQLIAVQARYTW